VSTLAALIAIAVALAIGLVVGARQQRRNARPVNLTYDAAPDDRADDASPEEGEASIPALDPGEVEISADPSPVPESAGERLVEERARIIRGLEAENAMLRRELVTRDAAIGQLRDFDADRRRVYREVAAAKSEAARYRQLVIDLEDNAPPPFFGAGAPDDLKLIVGVGPVLERMLQQLGITTYRQIARWTERDIEEFDAKLPEFPGRIRRDGWVTQARALHASKYGAPPSARDR
jgi:predicted flap endonuclease-1-like 5' DNA nuclease